MADTTNTVKKPTKRDNFNLLLSILDLSENNGFELPEEYTFDGLKNFVNNEISLLDKKAESAQKRANDKKAAGDELREKIYNVLSTSEFMTINDIIDALDDPSVSPQKVTARLGQMAKLDPPMVEKDMKSVPIPGEDKKTSKKAAYRKLVDMESCS